MLTKLFVTVDNYALAKRFGAKLDEVSGEWFVNGDVPPELVNLTVPAVPRIREPERAPPCPLCGALTIKRRRKSDKLPFWGCSRYYVTKCSGIVSYDYYLECENENAVSVGGALESAATRERSTAPRTAPSNPRVDNSLRLAISEIASLATTQLGGSGAANRWLARSRTSLAGKTPIQEMQSIAGCERVKEILIHIND